MRAPKLGASEATLEASPPDLHDWKRKFAEELAQVGAQRDERMRHESMLALAAVPTWTQPLADRIGRFWTAPDLHELHEEGWIERFASPLEEERTADLIRFAMPNATRGEVLALHAGDADERIWQRIAALGRAILDAGRATQLPRDTEQWAELASSAASSWQMLEAFDARVRSARTSSHIHRLIDAGRLFETLFFARNDLSLDLALERASRQLEVLRRKDDDRSHLLHFLRREEQITAIETLIGGDEANWALHLVGAGGIGKTMLLRHVASDFSDDRFAVSRIDFDYLNPDYPRIAPGLLLWAFGQDLKAYVADTSQLSLLNEADGMLDKLHQELRANAGAAAGSPIDHPHFRTALQLYVEVLSRMTLRVLLVLDTCEELARVRPDGSISESVRETFYILELLKAGVPGLRVIFSGRRLLASRGHGWTAEASELPARPYLSVHEVRGFTLEEGHAYLRAASVPVELHDAILTHCPDAGRVVNLRWNKRFAAAVERPRLNPYELKRYADWAAEKPHPSAQTIASSTNSNYVEFRIVRRLRDAELERLLPAIAVLGHVDDITLAALADIGPSDSRFERLERALRQQEWTSVRSVLGETGVESRRVYSVEPGLRHRLLEYAVPTRAEWMPLIDRALAQKIETTLQRSLRELDWTDFDATLNLFDALERPELAAQWWRRVADRLADQDDPAWTRDLLQFLRPSDAPTNKDANPATLTVSQRLRPGIVAIHATALMRLGVVSTNVLDLWSEVCVTLPHYPLRRGRARIRLLAASGRLVCAEQLSADDGREFRNALSLPDRWFDPDIASAPIAGIEALLDRIETYTREATSERHAAAQRALQLSRSLQAQFARRRKAAWAAEPEQGPVADLLAYAVCLVHRARWLAGDTSAAFSSALRAAQSLVDVRRRWPHWNAPDSIRLRIVLDYARLVVEQCSDPARVRRRLDRVASEISTIETLNASLDAQLLLGLRCRLVSWTHMPDEAERRLLLVALNQAPRAGSCVAQRKIAPPCCVAAEILTDMGQPTLALDRMRDLLRDSSEYHEEVRREIERTCLRIALRMRLVEEDVGASESLHASPEPDDLTLLRAVDAWRGSPRPLLPTSTAETTREALLHAWWRTHRDTAATLPSAGEIEKWLSLSRPPRPPSLAFDAAEALVMLGRRSERVGTRRSGAGDGQFSWNASGGDDAGLLKAMVFGEADRTRAADALRAALRMEALFRGISGTATWPVDVAKFGWRRAAALAMEEADLLLLRLPSHARSFASNAFDWYRQAGDTVGIMRSATLLALLEGPGDVRETAAAAKEAWQQLRSRPGTTLDPLLQPLALRLDLIGTPADRLAAVGSKAQPSSIATPPRHRTIGTVAPPDIAAWETRSATQLAADVDRPAVDAEPAFSILSRLRFVLAGAAALSGLIGIAALLDPISPIAAPAFALGGEQVSLILGIAVLCTASWAWRQWFIGRRVRHLAKAVISTSVTLACVPVATYAFMFDATAVWAAMTVFATVALRDAAEHLLERVRRKAAWRGGVAALNIAACALLSGLVIATLGVIGLTGIGAAILLGLAGWTAMQFARRTLAVRSAIVWAVEQEVQSGPSTSGPETTSLRVILRLQPSILFPRDLLPPKVQDLELRSEPPFSWEKGHAEFAATFQPDVRNLFSRWPHILKLHRARLHFSSAEPGDHLPAWDALPIYNTGPEAGNPRELPVLMLRCVPTHRHQDLATDVKSGLVTICGGDPRETAWCARAWRQKFDKINVVEPHQGTRITPSPQGLGWPIDTTVVHLVGTPQADSGGLRFRIGRDAGAASKTPSANGGPSAGQLLRVEDLTALPQLRLCVLQANADTTVVDRGGADRRRSGLMRTLAASLAAHGVPLVLVIPTLPGPLAAKVLGRIVEQSARRFASRPPDAERLLESLRHLVARSVFDSVAVRSADLLDPEQIVQHVAGPGMAWFRERMSEGGRHRLQRWQELPRQTLVGTILAELNHVLSQRDLARESQLLRAARSRRALWARLTGASNRLNRLLLTQAFNGALADGSAAKRREAMELAIDTNAFVSIELPRVAK